MNIVNPYIFAPPVDLSVNTFIGGVASTINTPALLATKLNIDVSRITNFSVVGSDVQCRITGSYVIPYECFFNNQNITFYNDQDGLVTSLSDRIFLEAFNLIYVNFKNVLSVGSQAFDSNTDFSMKIQIIYTPKATSYGTTNGNDFVFRHLQNVKIYVHSSLQTNNAGGEDGDLAYVRSQNSHIGYVTNYTIPNVVTNLSIGTVYATALQLNFTAPTGSTNAIDFYECYANGVYKNTISASGGHITGLSPNTFYTIEVKPVDIFFNKSSSNVVVQSTIATYYTDADANAYISAASLTGSEQESAYKLIVDLKTNSLWTKIPAIYPFKGTTAAQHKWNAKNLLDTDAAFRLTFNGTGTFSNNGFLTNGTGSYANTHLTPSNVQSVDSNGMTIVVGTIDTLSSGNDFIMGVYQNANTMSLIANRNNTSNYAKKIRLNGSDVSVSNGNTPTGVFTGVKQSATVTKLFRNSILQVSGNSGGNLPSIKIWIGDNNSNGSSYSNIKARIQIAIIHEGLSDAEVATLHAIIDLSETIAGRKTW